MGSANAFAFVEMDTPEAAREIMEVFKDKELIDTIVKMKENRKKWVFFSAFFWPFRMVAHHGPPRTWAPGGGQCTDGRYKIWPPKLFCLNKKPNFQCPIEHICSIILKNRMLDYYRGFKKAENLQLKI